MLGLSGSLDYELGIDYILTGLVRVGTSRKNRVRGYLALGGSTIQVGEKVSVLGVTADTGETANSVSYGAGVEGSLSDSLTIGAEFLRALSDTSLSGSTVTIDAITGQVRWRF